MTKKMNEVEKLRYERKMLSDCVRRIEYIVWAMGESMTNGRGKVEIIQEIEQIRQIVGECK